MVNCALKSIWTRMGTSSHTDTNLRRIQTKAWIGDRRAQAIDLLVVSFKKSNQVKSHWTFSPLWKNMTLNLHRRGGRRADTSHKVLIHVSLCYFYPLEAAVMLNQIIVIVWPEIDLTLSKLGWYFPLSGALKKYGIFSVWHCVMREAHPLKCSLKVSLCLEDTTCIYDIPPGYIPAFCSYDLWVGGCVPPITATVWGEIC